MFESFKSEMEDTDPDNPMKNAGLMEKVAGQTVEVAAKIPGVKSRVENALLSAAGASPEMVKDAKNKMEFAEKATSVLESVGIEEGSDLESIALEKDASEAKRQEDLARVRGELGI